MTALSFILRGLKHHHTGYLGVLLGSALGAMVLLGALFAGDSVKSTLRQIAEQRTGQTKLILTGGENLFRSQLASDIDDTSSALLQLRGQVNEPSGRSTGQVDLLGVDPRFWSFAPREMEAPQLSNRAWAINQELARTLDLSIDDAIILRLRKPGLVSGDAPLAENNDELITLRGTVTRILSDDEMGRFSLAATQLATPKVFLPLETLAEAIEHPNRANLILSRDESLATKVRSHAELADYGLTIKDIPLAQATEIRTERIFISLAIEEKIRQFVPNAKPTLTYLVNTLAANERETPYSMVTGADPSLAPFLPDDLEDDEIVLNSWEAEDLNAKVGDTVKLSYYVLSKTGTLIEEHADFTVRSVVPLEGLAADRLWTPDFPGIAEAENNADWESGLPLDTTRIRDKDETYWDDHRATPKAFITHRAAAKLWQNRWGSSTAFRSKVGPSSLIKGELLSTLTPTDAGLQVRDIATEAARAASSPVDIASLFLSMSFFLIFAAIALTAMLFRFNVEQRNSESGLLTAVGIPARKILRWRLAEGLVIITLGALSGTILAFAYTRGLLLFLEKIWNSGGERLFHFHAAPGSVIGGMVGFIVLMMITIWFTTRKQSKQTASLRLSAGNEEIPPSIQSRRPRLIAIISALIGIGSLAASRQLGPSSAFFLSGFAFLIAGLSVWRVRFTRPSSGARDSSRAPESPLPTSHVSLGTPAQLARLNLSRRPTRSLVAIGTLASAIFLVVSVTAFQKHGSGDWQKLSGGTGGYGTWIETSSPLTRLSSGKFEFQDDDIQDLLPIRVGSGDDASCFNLNSVSQPRLLAADTTKLEDRFTIKSTADGIAPSWATLREGEHLRAFIDETTLLWVLKMKLGDTIEYTDDQGTSFLVEIAGTLTESVFQGSFIVDESRFLAHYPSSSGYRLFLASTEKPPTEARPDLQKSLTDLGATVTPTAERLAAFHSVENTYISIFNVLGGLGVILGAAGLGLVTARNLAERKDELSMLHTIGISNRVIRSIITREVRTLILAALIIGLTAAIISILPSLPQQTSPQLTLTWIAVLALLTALCASFSAWLAYRASYRGEARTGRLSID
ncbi:FtsX-like permease family protein [Haloferula chungangensis]|uniref:FtsX-like permease family protein n=1 Tax=Haloferula chungangensis TaxID=1048331 RepID=A0ABW2LDQ9_9BACT